MSKRFKAALVIVVAVILASGMTILALDSRRQSMPPRDVRNEQQSEQTGQDSTKLIVSPDKSRVLSLLNQNGPSELWLMNLDGTPGKRVIKLADDEGVTSTVSSPDGKLVTFVIYNAAGHSPMTTTRTWVVQWNGLGLRAVTVPEPYAQFSTFDPKWTKDETLSVKVIVIADSGVLTLKYSFDYITGNVEKSDLTPKE